MHTAEPCCAAHVQAAQQHGAAALPPAGVPLPLDAWLAAPHESLGTRHSASCLSPFQVPFFVHFICLQELEASRSSAAAYRQQGLPARSGLDAGFTAGQLLRAGYSAAEVVQTGVALDKLRAAGIRYDAVQGCRDQG